MLPHGQILDESSVLSEFLVQKHVLIGVRFRHLPNILDQDDVVLLSLLDDFYESVEVVKKVRMGLMRLAHQPIIISPKIIH